MHFTILSHHQPSNGAGSDSCLQTERLRTVIEGRITAKYEHFPVNTPLKL